ncbi:MAG: SDR family oxidoreductase [bacterium]|nr:SDR family oxidoreductase [bacterium]
MSRLSGSRAVITGSGRGIGRAIAEAMAAEGAHVVISDLNGPASEEVAAHIVAAGGVAHAVACDIRDDKAVSNLAARSAELLGGHVNVLVNNAGVYRPRRFLDYEMADWDWTFQVNVFGVVRVTQAFLPAMLEHEQGRIINMSSIAGKWGSLWQSAYNASKHAVVGITKCLAAETGSSGVRVNAICPGFVNTDLVSAEELAGVYQMPEEEFWTMVETRAPIGRTVRPDEIAELAVYLASPPADGMTGQALTLSGGAIFV